MRSKKEHKLWKKMFELLNSKSTLLLSSKTLELIPLFKRPKMKSMLRVRSVIKSERKTILEDRNSEGQSMKRENLQIVKMRRNLWKNLDQSHQHLLSLFPRAWSRGLIVQAPNLKYWTKNMGKKIWEIAKSDQWSPMGFSEFPIETTTKIL